MNIKIVHTTLLALILANFLFTIVFSYSGPIWGTLLYGCVYLLLLKRKIIHPVLIAGIFGMALHLIELILLMGQDKISIEIIILITNIVIPIPLVYFGRKILQTEKEFLKK